MESTNCQNFKIECSNAAGQRTNVQRLTCISIYKTSNSNEKIKLKYYLKEPKSQIRGINLNLMKDVLGIYTEIYKISLTLIKDVLINGKTYHIHELKDLKC